MRIVDLIELKKHGKELSKEQIKFMIAGYVDGSIKDYQMSAMAMAILLKGMSSKETANLTIAMMESGDIFDLSAIKGIKVDKHSTGGIGDKTTIAVAPIVAALGVPVAKMSGRGLGFTGGTLDKLESIPGYKVEVTMEELIEQVNKVGIAVVGQTGDVVPADKKLYALRDVTATVDSLPLIVSSIMSKKLATGSDAILLDVKCGNGAFMKTIEDAIELAETMVQIGKHLNRDVRAEITSMERPLGKAIGNKNEILEAVDTLLGNGPKDFTELVLSAATEMLLMSKTFDDHDKALAAINEVIKNGKALEKFKEWITAQGGDVEKVFKEDFWNPKYSKEIKAEQDGYFVINSAVDFGLSAMKLGAGRVSKEDILDNEAGIQLKAKTNDFVKNGDVLFTLYSSNEISNEAIKQLDGSYEIKKEKVENKIILKKIS